MKVLEIIHHNYGILSQDFDLHEFFFFSFITVHLFPGRNGLPYEVYRPSNTFWCCFRVFFPRKIEIFIITTVYANNISYLHKIKLLCIPAIEDS